MRPDHPGDAAHPTQVDQLAVLGPDQARAGLVHGVLAEPERRQRPPRQTALQGTFAHLRQRLVRRGAQIDRCLATTGRGGPGCLQELLAGRHEVLGPTADQLGVADQHVAALRHQLDQQLHPVDQGGGECLHPVDGVPVGDLVQHLDQLGVLLGQLGGPQPDVVGQQQLAARRRGHLGEGFVTGALVRDGEVVDLLDGVAEEVDPDRVLLGRTEQVDDPAPDRELTTALHQIHPGVGRLDQPGGQLAEVMVLSDPDGDRDQVSQPLDLRLQDRADRGDDHAQRRPLGADEAAQHLQASTDGVRAGAEPLVRQRLPGRVVGDVVGSEQGPDRRGDLFGLTVGRGDHQDRTVGTAHRGRGSDRRRQERADRRRHRQVQGARRRRARISQRVGEGGLGGELPNESREGHRGNLSPRPDSPHARQPGSTLR